MATVDGLTLEFSNNRTVPDTLDAINDELQTIGAGVWPLDLIDRPSDIRALLGKPVLDATEAERVITNFLLPRERLLQIVAQVESTAAVSTRCSKCFRALVLSCTSDSTMATY